MKGEKQWWTVTTDRGARRTLAVSRGKAIRNVRWRLVMENRNYRVPTPHDFVLMRDIVVLEAKREEP